MRNSPIHYIAPSNVSIIPNCNDTSNDIAVTIPLGTKIKVYAPEAGIDMENNTWQEWTITGRNRSLQDMFSPYTIFARLSKTDRNDGYIVFAPKTLLGYNKVSDRLFVGVYADKYSSVIRGGNGFSVLYKEGGVEHQNIDPNYYYIRLGDVSEVKVQNRTITFDTGILGTEQYNTDWLLNPYGLPLRIVLSCVIDGEDAGQIPYLQWGKEASLSAKLIEGWTDDHDSAVKFWTITRNTGHEEADREWSYPDADTQGNSTPAPTDARKMPSGNIILAHLREGTDDIDGVPNATFTITAWGVPDSSGVPDIDDLYDKPEDNSTITEQDENKEELAVLASANITIMAESDVMQGQKGDTPIQAFRWYVDGITPKTPTDTTKDVPAPADEDIIGDVTKAVPINTWSATAPDRPAEAWALWLTQSVRRMTNDGTVTRDPWSTPVRISGAKGEPGEDSKEREWIYIPKPEETSFSGDSHPDNITVPATESKGQNKTDDDFVPSGWSDNAMSTNDNTNRFVYASWRDWNKNTKQWGPFSNPIIWSNWGRQGIDGDGTEYVYIRTKNKIAPIMDSVQTGYQNDRFRPTIDSASQTEAQTEQGQTTDNPKGTDSTYPYEWVATRSKEKASDDGSRAWTKFTGANNDYKMSLWSNWADSAADTYQLILQPGAVKYNEIGSSTYISFNILKNIAGEGVVKIDNTVRSEDGLFVAVQMKKTAEGEMKWYDISGWAFLLTKTYADSSEYMINVELRKRLSGKTYDVETPSTYMVADAKTLIIAKDGENGESGYSVSPENIIINQSLSNPDGLSSINQQVNITVRMGATTYVPTNVRVVGRTDVLPSDATDQSSTKTIDGDSSFTIKSIGTYSYTEGSTQKTQYYDRVTFKLSVTFRKDGQDITVTHYVNLYVNLLGSFKTTIEADVETSIAKKTYTILDTDGTVKYVDLATYIRSSSENLYNITEAVTDEDGTYISSSQIKQTAEKISLEVSSQAKNIKGRNFLVGSGFYSYKRTSNKNFSVSPAFYEALNELKPTQANPVYIGVSVWYFAFDKDVDSTTGGNVGRLGISPFWRSGGVYTHFLELMAGVDSSNHQVKLSTNILTRAKRVVAFTSVPNPNDFNADSNGLYYNQLSPNKSASRSIVGFAKLEILTADDENLITDWSYAPEESFVSGTNLIEDNLSEPLLLSYGNVQLKDFTITNLADRVKNKVVKLYADIKWVGTEDDHNFYFHLNITGNAYTFAMPRQQAFKEPSPTHEGYTRYWFRKEMAVISTSDMTDAATLGRVYINGNFTNANQSSLKVAEVGVMLETFSAGDDVGNALRRTGIDITNGKIILDAETTVATGTFAAQQVITETESMMTTVNGGSIVVSSKTTGSYGKFAINSIGEVILQMYDREGKLILNIGGTPSSYQNAYWQLDAKMKYIGSSKPDASQCYVYDNTSGVLSYYQLTLGEVTNQDTTITYYYTDGSQLSPSTHANLINHNGATFKNENYELSDLNSNLSSYRISDGYYVPVNNGVFMTKTEDIGGGYKKTTYYATAYRYSGGFRTRTELITVKEETLSPSA